jgi:hypothetical protein
MLRVPPTRILLSDYEVHQTLHSIWTQKFMTLNLAYSKPLSEGDKEEAEYDYDSSRTSYTRSSSARYFMSEDDRRACEVLKRYRDTKIYMNSATSNLDDLPAYSAGPHATLDTRSTDQSESYPTEGKPPPNRGLDKPTSNCNQVVYRNVVEITDFQISSTPQESSVETSSPAAIILSPRSPEPTPRARRGSRMHRPALYRNFPVLQVQVPDVYERMSDIVLFDIMSEGGT